MDLTQLNLRSLFRRQAEIMLNYIVAQPSADSDKLNSVKIARMRAGFDAFQLDATAYPGNSGSPVFELGSGRVIGVINSVLVKETKETMLARPSGITYAIPSRYIKPLLSGLETARP